MDLFALALVRASLRPWLAVLYLRTSVRMGDYRVLFDVDGECIVIRRIRDRKDAYD